MKSLAYIFAEFSSAFGSRARALPDRSRDGGGVFLNRGDGFGGEKGKAWKGAARVVRTYCSSILNCAATVSAVHHWGWHRAAERQAISCIGRIVIMHNIDRRLNFARIGA